MRSEQSAPWEPSTQALAIPQKAASGKRVKLCSWTVEARLQIGARQISYLKCPHALLLQQANLPQTNGKASRTSSPGKAGKDGLSGAVMGFEAALNVVAEAVPRIHPHVLINKREGLLTLSSTKHLHKDNRACVCHALLSCKNRDFPLSMSCHLLITPFSTCQLMVPLSCPKGNKSRPVYCRCTSCTIEIVSSISVA